MFRVDYVQICQLHDGNHYFEAVWRHIDTEQDREHDHLQCVDHTPEVLEQTREKE